MLRRKNIRAKLPASDSVVGCALDDRPPVGLQKDLFLQPVRDELLASGGATGLPQLGRELLLGAAGDLDSSLQRSNVTLLHDYAKYTNRFVRATTPFVCDDNKEACTVLTMPNTARKQQLRSPAAAPKSRTKKRQAKPGQDGLTLGVRLQMAMAHETGRRGHEYRQADLLSDVNRLAKAPEDNPIVTQQMLSAIMLSKVSRSSFTHLMAAACHVNPLWLSDGIGNMTD